MKDKLFALPEHVTADDIKDIRKRLRLTQKEFALLIQRSRSTVERWEIREEPIGLWYMHNQTICTVIEVNEVHREVEIVNYTDNVLFRAFGSEERPDYQMYEEFLRSRYFPESRDKMKLILRDLDLPFYDPFMIIEKTETRKRAPRSPF